VCTCVFLLYQKYFNMILDNNTSLYDGALQHGEEDDELAADLGTPPAGVVTPGAGFPEPTPGSVPVVLPEG
jgi:hypothetical protein